MSQGAAICHRVRHRAAARHPLQRLPHDALLVPRLPLLPRSHLAGPVRALLQPRVAPLRARLAPLRSQLAHLQSHVAILLVERARLLAERARLRPALTRLLARLGPHLARRVRPRPQWPCPRRVLGALARRRFVVLHGGGGGGGGGQWDRGGRRSLFLVHTPRGAAEVGQRQT